MAHFLLKTEPGSYSFDDLVRDGRTRWDGIKNPVALKNLKTCAAGDVAVIYHTGGVKAAIGTARIVGAAYPDPEKADPRLLVVDLEAGERLGRPVTLDEMKSHPAFAGSPLLRQGRLSFVALTEAQWGAIQRLANR